ncbi:hypothetical protein RI129_001728 [Pyrocoelia pectoralis]|uniref:Nbr1 FW domain-containing protein n=1 Tax=Pyrocoelia pectoralis TaxID=417401 RepID=A0AAN7VW68_9COLE
MDVDNSQSEGPGSLEIEQSLLQQFSCMGTTDKEELVQQLQKLLGSQLNNSTAAFFLDMNNWNLQAAICSYFDIESPMKLPSMALVSDPIANECESVEPCVSFRKVWHVLNNGTEAWPFGCHVKCAAGDSLGAEPIQVPCLEPGTGTLLNLRMTSPALPGMYQSKWRLCTASGSYFGDPLWAIITVVEEGTMALTQQLSHFSDLGSSNLGTVSINPFIQPRANENIQGGSAADPDSGMC